MLIRSNLYINLVLVILLGLLFVPFPTKSLWWREVFNSGHAALFASLSFVIYRHIATITRCSNALVIYFLVLLVGMLFGALIELLQSFVQRDASLNDLYNNFFGLLAGLCLIAAYNLKDIKCKRLIVVFFMAASGGFMLLAMSPLIQLSWHYVQRHNAFPVIVDFDANWSSSFVRFKNVDRLKRISSAQDKSLSSVRFNRGKYPGISVIEVEPDWSNYHLLRMNIFSEYERNIVLSLRVHDDKHNQDFSDRFNVSLTIHPGLNEIGVPLDQIARGPANRELDLTNIAGIVLFVGRLDAPMRLEVGSFYLE